MSLVCTRMSSVFTSMYLYVIRMSLVCGFIMNQSQMLSSKDLTFFEFLNILNISATIKKKNFRFNHNRFMTKSLKGTSTDI